MSKAAQKSWDWDKCNADGLMTNVCTNCSKDIEIAVNWSEWLHHETQEVPCNVEPTATPMFTADSWRDGEGDDGHEVIPVGLVSPIMTVHSEDEANDANTNGFVLFAVGFAPSGLPVSWVMVENDDPERAVTDAQSAGVQGKRMLKKHDDRITRARELS
jgi:hypothetical protein